MENLLHLAPSYTSLPDAFVIPPDRLTAATSAAVSLPVIDLSGSRDEVCRAIVDAGKEFGFFQVVNHGVSDLAIRDMESVCEEFFRLPAADKAHLYSEDSRRPNRLFSGSSYDTGGVKYWRDCLHLTCAFPVGDSTESWPGKPPRFREFVEKFAAATRGAGMELLRLLCHGMGLRPGYFEGDISGGDLVLRVNHYPPCPDPSAALGLPPHRDRNLITLLLPGMVVPGLQIAYNGNWVDVEPVPNALVVNFGKQLEVVTNGALKSVEHRAATNSARARTSVATFIRPTADCLVGPAVEFVGKASPPCYPTLTFSDYMRIYNVARLEPSLTQKDI